MIEVDKEEASKLRYSERLDRRSLFAKHHAFWHALGRGPNFQGVVTTNYDLTIERSLRDSPTHPACHYGGLKRPHYAIRRPDLPGPPGPPTFELKGDIPLFKLHGSLNWHLLRSGKIEIYRKTAAKRSPSVTRRRSWRPSRRRSHSRHSSRCGPALGRCSPARRPGS